MSDDVAKRVIRDFDRMNGERGTWLTHWQELSDYIQPNRADYYKTRTPGQKRMTRVFDSTPIMANEQFASGLHGLLTSPTLRWFNLKAEDDRINADDQAARWFDDATDRMYALFNGPRHNFASQSHELYCDLGCIGTAVMAVLETTRNNILFTTRNLRECVIAENEEDRVDCLTRKWTYTARQAYQAWGDKAGERVLKAYAEKPDTPFEFLHAVCPRRERDPQRGDAAHMAFESIYVSLADAATIVIGGFDEFPYLVPRFAKATGETYGRGPGSQALPDIKSLNELAKQIQMAAQLQTRPPLNVPDDGFLYPINSTPGGINHYRSGSKDRVEPWNMGIDVRVGLDMLNAYRQSILQAFYVTWMMMPSDPQDPASSGKGVTATYTLQQRDEKMRLLSPMLARMQTEFLGPLIDRVFAIMWRRSMAVRFGPGSMLAPPPPIVAGATLRVEYVSPIAIAQKSSQLDSLNRLVQTALLLGQIDPEVPRTLDVDAILRLTGTDLATPAVALKSKEQIAAEQQAQAQQQAAMQNQEALAKVATAAQQGTAAVKNLSDAGGVVAGNGAVPLPAAA